METIRILLVVGHLMAFAIALSAVLREDWRMLTTRRINPTDLAETSKIVVAALVGLAVTGVALIGIDTGFDPVSVMAQPKLLAKLSVVGLLTLNGAVLHAIAFPAFSTPQGNARRTAVVLCVVGAISSTSWLFASFLGVAKPLAASLGYSGFMGLYAGLVAGGIAVGVVTLRLRIEALLLLLPLPAPEGPIDDALRRMVGYAADTVRVVSPPNVDREQKERYSSGIVERFA